MQPWHSNEDMFWPTLTSSFRLVSSFVVLPTCVRGGDSTFAFAHRAENFDLVVILVWTLEYPDRHWSPFVSLLVTRYSLLVTRFSFLVSRFSFLVSRFSVGASLRTDTRQCMCICHVKREAWDEFQLQSCTVAQNFRCCCLQSVRGQVRILTVCGGGEGCPTAVNAPRLDDKLRCGTCTLRTISIALSLFFSHLIPSVILCLGLCCCYVASLCVDFLFSRFTCVSLFFFNALCF